MPSRTPKPRSKHPRGPQGLSVEQRTNALRNSALQASQRAKRQPVDMDWAAAIERLKKMLDRLEES